MAKFRYVVETDTDPDLVWRALTEFGPARERLWPDLSAGVYRVLQPGDRHALVHEGTAILGGIWVNERYDWSEPGVVRAIAEDSNVVRPGGEWRWEVRPRRGGGTTVAVSMDRRSFGWRGRLLHGLFQVTGGRVLAGRLRQMLDGLPDLVA
ncbi:MAG: SRPBCC family protein [Candidatus Dormibacteria bacterium]